MTFRPLLPTAARGPASACGNGLPWSRIPRKRAGRWHPLEFVLALAVCAFTAAGHDSPDRDRGMGGGLLAADAADPGRPPGPADRPYLAT